MINLKKGLVAVAGIAMVAGVGGVALTSCGGDQYANTITVWCPESDVNYFNNTIIPAFKEAHGDLLHITDAEGNVTGEMDIQVIEQVGEGDVVAGSDNINEVADVFCIADDNIRTMVQRGYIEDFNSDETSRVTSDGQGAVDSFKIGDSLYALPYRNDNSYMLYYDTRIVSDEQAKTWEGLIAAAKAQNNATIYFQIANSWTFPSILFSEGEVHVDTVDGTTYQMTDFGSNADVHQALFDFVQLYAANTNIINGELDAQTAAILTGLDSQTTGSRTAAYIIYNFWNETSAKLTELGLDADTVKVTTLPSFAGHAMKPFIGYKGMGMKSSVSEQKHDAAKEFVRFATSADMQKGRVTELKQGVTNLSVQSELAEEIAALPHMNAINETVASGNYVPQGINVTGDFWTPVETLGRGIVNDPTAHDSLEEARADCQTIASATGWMDVSAAA